MHSKRVAPGTFLKYGMKKPPTAHLAKGATVQ
jgi:hypothetical protein